MPEETAWPKTPWSEILRLRGANPGQAREALNRILERYQQPIQGYMARHAPPDHAADWAQDFCVKFLKEALPAKADASHPLRHYLAAAMRNFVVDQYRKGRESGMDRGEMDTLLAEDLEGAEQAFHCALGQNLVQNALRRLDGAADGGKSREQDLAILRLRYGLTQDGQPCSYEQIGQQLGKPFSTSDIDNALRRARKDVGTALREEVRLLLHSDAGVDAELWRISELLDEQPEA